MPFSTTDIDANREPSPRRGVMDDDDREHENDLPPAHLSRAMREFWLETMRQHELPPAKVLVLTAACGAHDTMEKARTTIAKEGMASEFNGKPHPLLLVEHRARGQFSRLIRQLNL
jgi:phage terminase small subunit